MTIPAKLLTAGFAAWTGMWMLLSGCGAKPEAGAASSSPSGTVQAAPATVKPSASPSVSPSQSPSKSWTKPPEMSIDTNKTYKAVFKTSKGSFTVELFAKDAPKAVNNFVFLSKEHFYDGVTFHRIIESFMIQTGDPKGNGTGGPGYKFAHEPTQYKYDKGIVAMANSGPDTNGSQFFIVTGNASHLNAKPDYTVFGKVIEGMDTTVTSIAKTPVKTNPLNGSAETPTEKVTIDSIQITEE